MFHHHFTLKLYYEAFNIGAVIARRLGPRATVITVLILRLFTV